MVWAGVLSKDKTPLVFIPPGTRVNAKYYQNDIIRKVVIPWGKKVFGRRQWTFQQDGAPAHSAKATISLLKKEIPNVWCKGVWPPYSPDLNPMDYSIWGNLSAALQGKRFATVKALKYALLKAWDRITPEQLSCIVNSFPKRLRACIKAEGGNFEHLLK